MVFEKVLEKWKDSAMVSDSVSETRLVAEA